MAPIPAWPSWAVPRSEGLWAGHATVRGRRFSFAFWDSRRIDLQLVAGRVDPGGHGALPDVLWDRQIAAFNGGFRSVHGHYGLRAEGRTFLPARAGLATLALGDDGWRLGTLPDHLELTGASAFRQNLPPLLADGRFDPTGRGSFGAVAPGKSGARTTRTALGLRADARFVFAYGIDVIPVELAAAVAEAGAAYAMALDMNDGQAGFEWLAVGAAARGPSSPPSHDAARATWTGVVRDHRIRAERLTTPMGTPLPRWLMGDPRDYFVLLRSDAPLPPAQLDGFSGFARKEK